jgi:hypothetical protein
VSGAPATGADEHPPTEIAQTPQAPPLPKRAPVAVLVRPWVPPVTTETLRKVRAALQKL